jgi:hypothetical protein
MSRLARVGGGRCSEVRLRRHSRLVDPQWCRRDWFPQAHEIHNAALGARRGEVFVQKPAKGEPGLFGGGCIDVFY